MAGCAAKNLQISGGPGRFEPGWSGARKGAIYKGYHNELGGVYRYSVQIGNDVCSGTIPISGGRQNVAIKLYPGCKDAGSYEF